MIYFWLIPAAVIVVLLLWGLYVAATKRVPHRTDGKTLVDKGSPNPRERG